MVKETKKIGVMVVLAWIFSIFFIMGGLGMFSESILSGFLMVISGLLILPPMTNWLDKKFKFKLKIWLKIIIIFILFAIAGSQLGTVNSPLNQDVPENDTPPAYVSEAVEEEKIVEHPLSIYDIRALATKLNYDNIICTTLYPMQDFYLESVRPQ